MKHIKKYEDFISESNINEAVKIKDDKDLISKLDKGSLPLGVTEVKWGDFKIRIKTEKNDKGKMYSMFIFDAEGDTRDDIYFPQSGHDTFKTDNKNRKIAYYLINKYYKEGMNESVVNENNNPEGDAKVLSFLKRLAKEWDIPVARAADFVKQSIKRNGY